MKVGPKKTTPSREAVEAAAKAWLSWQFPGREWDASSSAMRERFREGARVVLTAASSASAN